MNKFDREKKYIINEIAIIYNYILCVDYTGLFISKIIFDL